MIILVWKVRMGGEGCCKFSGELEFFQLKFVKLEICFAHFYDIVLNSFLHIKTHAGSIAAHWKYDSIAEKVLLSNYQY